MKIECLKEKLEEVIKMAEKITSKNISLPVLKCVLLEAKENNLKIKATNLDLGIEINLPVKCEREGIVAVPGTVLNNFLQNINDKNIKVEQKGNNLIVSTSKNYTSIKIFPNEDFPTIPEVLNKKTFSISSRDLTQGLKSVFYSASNSNIKPELASVMIYYDGEYLVFVATDSFRLAEKKIKAKNINELNNILIPYKNVHEIIRILEPVNFDVEVNYNQNQISFSINNIFLTSRVIEGSFPDYRQIIPKDYKTEAIVLKQDLIDTLKIANIFTDKFNQINIKTKPAKRSFEVLVKNSDVGENTNRTDAALSGEEADINFNYRYISDCFQSVSRDSVSLRFCGVGRPLVISPVGDKSFLYVVMPMK